METYGLQELQSLNLDQAITVLTPLLLFVIGMVVYAVFVFKFYKFIAQKDIFKLNLHEHNRAEHEGLRMFIAIVFYVLEYLLFFPILAFTWFGILTVLLVFLVSDPTLELVLLLSMAVVAAVRVTAYYKQELSEEVSKTLPLALLAVFLIDLSSFSAAASWQVLWEIPSHWEVLIYYLGFIMVLELGLRIVSGMYAVFVSRTS